MDWRKSSRSNNVGECVEWTRATACSSGACLEVAGPCTSGSNCVEVAHVGTVWVRDSKNPAGGILEFDPLSWASFVRWAPSICR